MESDAAPGVAFYTNDAHLIMGNVKRKSMSVHVFSHTARVNSLELNWPFIGCRNSHDPVRGNFIPIQGPEGCCLASHKNGTANCST